MWVIMGLQVRNMAVTKKVPPFQVTIRFGQLLSIRSCFSV